MSQVVKATRWARKEAAHLSLLTPSLTADDILRACQVKARNGQVKQRHVESWARDRRAAFGKKFSVGSPK